jgi:DNA-3-methyladenine glycosylase II
MHNTFSTENFEDICRQLAEKDAELRSILDTYGYPPFWSRENNYESLVHIILEQQVSLASARAALEKLREKVGIISPENVQRLSDEEFRAAYFSRQKTSYVRHLTEQVTTGAIDFAALERLPDAAIREQLIRLKGVGSWTVDVYLIMVLHRADHFPIGDIAAVNGLKQLKNLPPQTSAEAILALTEKWRPHRSIATMLIWHDYLSRRKKRESS